MKKKIAAILAIAMLAFAGVAQSALIVGTSGDDVLNGTQEADVLRGKGGNDVLRGNRGNDVNFGGAGNDVFLMVGKNGQPFGKDRARCGSGFDRVFADKHDVVGGHCERVFRS